MGWNRQQRAKCKSDTHSSPSQTGNPSELISADATLGGVEKYAYGPGIIDGATALRAGYGFSLN